MDVQILNRILVPHLPRRERK